MSRKQSQAPFALLFLVLCLLGCERVQKDTPSERGKDWTTDYNKALEKSKVEKKMVLMDFTGSDWCGWCMKLDEEVFSRKEFKDYARDKLILVTVDFPRGKMQSESLKGQNQELQQRFGIEGFPTILVLNPEGKLVGKLGYMQGGPSAFITELKRLEGAK